MMSSDEELVLLVVVIVGKAISGSGDVVMVSESGRYPLDFELCFSELEASFSDSTFVIL